jgi:hypothetical protein
MDKRFLDVLTCLIPTVVGLVVFIKAKAFQDFQVYGIEHNRFYKGNPKLIKFAKSGFKLFCLRIFGIFICLFGLFLLYCVLFNGMHFESAGAHG